MRPSLRSIIPSWIFSQVVTAESSWCFDPCFFGSTTDAAYKSSCLLSASPSSLSFPSHSSARSGGCIVLDDRSTWAMILLPSFEESSSWMTFFGSLYLYAFLMPRYSPSTGFSSAKKSYFQWSVIIRDAVAHSRRVAYALTQKIKWKWRNDAGWREEILSVHLIPIQNNCYVCTDLLFLIGIFLFIFGFSDHQ